MRAAAFLRSESGVVALALAAVTFHVLDDNYVQPAPGTSAADHLASGLIPLAVLIIAAALYSGLRPGLRASLAMTLGAIAITFGVPGAYYLRHGSASGDHYSGLLAIVAGRRTAFERAGDAVEGPAHRGHSAAAIPATDRHAAITLLAGLVALTFVIFPVGYAYIYTHTGRTAVNPDLRVPYESVKVTTSDGLELSASYVASKNRAAVILFPGATRSDQARMLIRHGYGVLLLDPRGQGGSEGDTIRWAGDRDLIGGVEYLRTRRDVDPDRIGGFGFSVGGELLLEAAAQSSGLKAVVSEGAGIRLGEGRERRRRTLNPRTRTLESGVARHDRRRDRVFQPRPAAADRRSDRPHLAASCLSDLRGPRHGRRKDEATRLLRRCRSPEGNLEGPRL